jgi:hypothetical protein
VRMPIAELRTLFGPDVPPHRDGCTTQKRHVCTSKRTAAAAAVGIADQISPIEIKITS